MAATERKLRDDVINLRASQMQKAALRRRFLLQDALMLRHLLAPIALVAVLTVPVHPQHYLPAEVLAYLPLFERANSHSVRFRVNDKLEASSVMAFIGEYRPDLTP